MNDSVVQAVVRQGEWLCAESDHRKGGYPAGYWVLPHPFLPKPGVYLHKEAGIELSIWKDTQTMPPQGYTATLFLQLRFISRHGKWLYSTSIPPPFTPNNRQHFCFYFSIIHYLFLCFEKEVRLQLWEWHFFNPCCIKRSLSIILKKEVYLCDAVG